METVKTEWGALFNEVAYDIWKVERKELRMAAVLIHVLGVEFENIKSKAESKLNDYRGNFSPVNSVRVEESPDLFIYESPEIKVEGRNETLIQSPKINKTRRYNKTRKHKQVTPTRRISDIIEATPRPVKKIKTNLSAGSFKKSHDTLVDNDSDETLCDSSQEKKPSDGLKIKPGTTCQKCESLGKHCHLHKIHVPTQDHRTFTGFWNVNFTEDDDDGGGTSSQNSTIFY